MYFRNVAKLRHDDKKNASLCDRALTSQKMNPNPGSSRDGIYSHNLTPKRSKINVMSCLSKQCSSALGTVGESKNIYIPQ